MLRLAVALAVGFALGISLKREARAGEQIPGGLASGKSPSDFDPAALEAGTKVELEHTYDPDTAREIAMDHLTENPNYYDILRKAGL